MKNESPLDDSYAKLMNVTDQTKDIISKLGNLDLKSYPKNDVYSLIPQLNKIGIVLVSFHEGKTLLRARPNRGDERFTKIDQLSYKPPEKNTTYQRASIPGRSMFYGSTISESLEKTS